MGELQLYGMKATFDGITATAIKRRGQRVSKMCFDPCSDCRCAVYRHSQTQSQLPSSAVRGSESMAARRKVAHADSNGMSKRFEIKQID